MVQQTSTSFRNTITEYRKILNIACSVYVVVFMLNNVHLLKNAEKTCGSFHRLVIKRKKIALKKRNTTPTMQLGS